MASKKTLNSTNLEALGAERLAALLMEISDGNAAAKRRLRLELTGAQNPAAVGREVRKRLTAIDRARSFVDWQKRKVLVGDLEAQRRAIVDQVAKTDPAEALELLWRFMALASSVFERCDDSSGTVIAVFHAACADLGAIGSLAKVAPAMLAEQVCRALEENDCGQYDGLIAVMTPALGPTGLERLKKLIIGLPQPTRPSSGENDRSYPFSLSDDGEVVSFKPRHARPGGRFYLLCLVLAHVAKSRVLDVVPHETAVRVARNRHFQCLATLALAGEMNGPSIWMGWPRLTDESILDVVGRACALAGTGTRKALPGQTASAYSKDGGIDVLSWRPAVDHPPPTSFAFGQTASGQDWAAKSARLDAESLMQGYFEERPNCNHVTFTVVPHRLADDEMRQQHHRHGAILDRTRAPIMAWRGLIFSQQGMHVDGANSSALISRWLRAFRRFPGVAYKEA